MSTKYHMINNHLSSQRTLSISVFISGMATMAVEFLASRLLGNVFGTSNIVWASIIGLILLYLTAGYWLGGKLADRSPQIKNFYQIMIWAGFAIGIIPIVSRPILQVSADAFDQLALPILFGSFASVLILFIIPVTLLGMIPPFALRLNISETNQAGKISGRLSAISTLGSFLGTFVTVLIFIPLIGTYRSFIIFSLLVTAIALLGLWVSNHKRLVLTYAWIPLLVLLIGYLGITGPDKRTEGLIIEDESAYNYIQVLEKDGFRYLRLNEGQGMHSIYHPTQYFYGGPWSQVLVAPFFNPAPYPIEEIKNIAIIGLAAGTSARQANYLYPGVHVDGYEIDPNVISLGRDYFDMNFPNLSVFVEDGRWGIAHSNNFYQIISVDAYRPPYIPPHMTTIEFFEVTKSKLSPDGVLTLNVGRSSMDRKLVDALSNTLLQVYPNIFIVDIADTFNTIIFAPKNPLASWDHFFRNYYLAKGTGNDDLVDLMSISINGHAGQLTSSVVFTDDKTSIEWITNKIVLDYIFTD